MALQTQERTIDGHAWAITQLPWSRGLKLSVRAAKVIGPVVAALGGKGLDAEAAPALMAAFSGLDPEEILGIARECFQTATRDNKPIGDGIDEVLRGRIMETYQAMWFALQVHCGFDVGALIAAGRAAMTPAASPSPSPST